jgi:peptidoglycan-N-acetylglucosamine deacetylase
MPQQKTHILSFDIEDWFLCRQDKRNHPQFWNQFPQRVEENSFRILSFLDELKLKAHFFVLGYIAETHPDLIKEIARRGHSIGFHSYYHLKPELQSSKQFEEELVKGLTLLENLTGMKIMGYRAPGFSLNASCLWIIPILKKHGILYSSSTKAGRHLHSQKIPNQPFQIIYQDTSMIEFPLNRVFGYPFSGSGYFRILPLKILTTLYNHSNYINSYFHPRDFDEELPNSSHLPIMRNLMNRVGTKNSLHKIKTIFKHQKILRFDEAHLLAKQNGELPVLRFNKDWG